MPDVFELSFRPIEPLLKARRRVAPGAKFNGLTKRWTMNEDEYAAFWTAACECRRHKLIQVHLVDGQPIPP